jgi:RNA polymerase-binding transcription factor DksA
MVFFAAGNSREKLEENRRRLLESCGRFIDFARLESHPMSRYLLVS